MKTTKKIQDNNQNSNAVASNRRTRKANKAGDKLSATQSDGNENELRNDRKIKRTLRATKPLKATQNSVTEDHKSDAKSTSDEPKKSKVRRVSAKTGVSDERNDDIPVRRSTRLRKATQLYSQEVAPNVKTTRKVSNVKIMPTIMEETNESSCETIVSNDKPRAKQQTARNGIRRKSIAKSKRKKKLKFVGKGLFELLHSKLGLVSKRLSVIPEMRESDFDDSL